MVKRSPHQRKAEKDGSFFKFYYLKFCHFKKDGKRRKKDGKKTDINQKTEKDGYNNHCSVNFQIMDIAAVLEFLDEVVHRNTGKRLNKLQRGIIEGTLKQQKYADIADNYDLSPGHVKDMGYELLQLLSNIFGEKVTKNNLESILERQGNINLSFGNESINTNNSNIIGSVNICPKHPSDIVDNNPPVKAEKSRSKNKGHSPAIAKLKKFGLTDEQIAEALGLPLSEVKQIDSM